VAKIKRIFRGLIALCLFLGLCGGYQDVRAQMPATGVHQFADLETVDTNWHIDQSIPDTYELIAENTLFQLYVDKNTLAFKVVDKRSRYVWSSNLDEKQDGDRLNKIWTAFAQSGISIDYLDQKATSQRASITTANKTIDITPVNQGIRASVHFLDPTISMDVIIKLEINGVSVEVPFSSVKEESPDYKLGTLYTYPFFGATRGDSVPGYMFIPDGSGSLIQFGSTTKATNMFYGKYYGADLGMLTTIPYDSTVNPPYEISIPVTGMVHGYKQNAYICIVEKGAPYGEIQAHPAGIITNFNFMYNAFTYNQSYFQATNRSGDGVTILQPRTNAFDVKLQYRFLTQKDGDYVGMARSYQQYLVEKGVLKKIAQPDGNIGIKLEFLGGDKQKVLLWNQIIKMTTISQMGDILNGLGIKNPDVVYYGWQPLGASSMPPISLRLDGSLGNVNQLHSLADKVAAGGGNFYLYLDPQAALKDESGYSLRNDLAISITNSNLMGYNRGKLNYYLDLAAMNKRYSSLSHDVFYKPNVGLALDGIGSTLYGDYKRNHLLNREESIVAYQDMLAKNQGSTSFYMPNDYMFGYMKAYYDIPLTDSGYIYTTETVPFLQIVLAGYVPFYGPAINFSSNARDDLLRQVDFDVYPSYFLTQEVTAKILNTSSNWIYTSSYAQWGQEIKQTYQWMENLLGPVEGQEIVARQVLADGVVATTYENGKQIIVNYNDTPFSYRGVTVGSKDAVIREVVP
jgi:hypothetical protein